MIYKNFLFISILILASSGHTEAQTKISGKIESNSSDVAFANIVIEGNQNGTFSDENGSFELLILEPGVAVLSITSIGYFKYRSKVDTLVGYPDQIRINMRSSNLQLNQVVVTGSMKQTFVKESPVKVEVITSTFLSKSPTNNIVEAIQTVNGVQEQINCGVCGTNDIHINGITVNG